MRSVMVRYTVKPDQVEANEQLVRDVYDGARATQPEGLRYGTFKLDDGVSFVHLATQGEEIPLRGSKRSSGSRQSIADRCDSPPSSPSCTSSARTASAGTGRERRGHEGRPWRLKTPPLTSDYEMYLDERMGPR